MYPSEQKPRFSCATGLPCARPFCMYQCISIRWRLWIGWKAKPWQSNSMQNVFSFGHATLHLAKSVSQLVHPSVRNDIFELLSVFALLLIPNCIWIAVYDLVINDSTRTWGVSGQWTTTLYKTVDRQYKGWEHYRPSSLSLARIPGTNPWWKKKAKCCEPPRHVVHSIKYN